MPRWTFDWPAFDGLVLVGIVVGIATVAVVFVVLRAR